MSFQLAACTKTSELQKKQWAKALKTTPDRLCQKLHQLFQKPSPGFSLVVDVYLLFFKHSTLHKTKQDMLQEIYHHVHQFATTDWEWCMQWIKGADPIKIAEFIVHLVHVIALHRIKNVYKQVDMETYPHLLQLKRRTKKQAKQLEDMLHGKVCSCIKKVKTKSFFTKSKYNPYAICVSSVYNKRGLPGRPNGPTECKKFD